MSPTTPSRTPSSTRTASVLRFNAKPIGDALTSIQVLAGKVSKAFEDTDDVKHQLTDREINGFMIAIQLLSEIIYSRVLDALDGDEDAMTLGILKSASGIAVAGGPEIGATPQHDWGSS